MKLVLNNSFYRFYLLSHLFNSLGASLYNIIFVIYAATLFHSEFLVGLANLITIIPVFFQIFVGRQADQTVEKRKWVIWLGFVQAGVFSLVAFFSMTPTLFAFSVVALCNIVSDVMADFKQGLQMGLIQANVAEEDLMEAFSTRQFVAQLCALCGQSLGVLLLTMSHQHFAFLALVNAFCFLISSFLFFGVPKGEISVQNQLEKKEEPVLERKCGHIFSSIWQNMMRLFDTKGKVAFLLLSSIVLINILGSATLSIFNIALLNKGIGLFSYATSLLLIQVAYVLGVLVSSLFPNDLFSKQPFHLLLVEASCLLVGLGIVNFLGIVSFLSPLFLFGIGYFIGKINPKLTARLLKMISPDTLAQTGAALDVLFLLMIPIGTILFTGLVLLSPYLAWGIFSIIALSLLGLSSYLRSET